MATGNRSAIGRCPLSGTGSAATEPVADWSAAWPAVDHRGYSKTFRFGTSAQVLAFSIRAWQLTDDLPVKAAIRLGLGRATVTLTDDIEEKALVVLIAGLERAAADIRERPGACRAR